MRIATALVCIIASAGAARAQDARCGATAVLGDRAPGWQELEGAYIAEAGVLGALRAGQPRWRETARVVRGAYTLVALEWTGEAAMLVALREERGGYCVDALFAYVFGGLGVDLVIGDVAPTARGGLLVALEALATYNDPAGANGDPHEPRRLVLHLVPGAAAVIVADTREPRFARHAGDHWYFRALPGDTIEVIAAGARRSRRWRFDPASRRLTGARAARE